ncbi:MAG: hypothetical protein ACR2HV_10605, partial [Acidimicrobiales bacterium]
GDTANELLGRRLRLVALLEGRDLAAFDAELEAFAITAQGLGHARVSWCVPLWRATRVLLQGRFTECGRQNADAARVARQAGLAAAERHCTVQLFGLRRAQDRVVELEALARSLAAAPTDGGDSGATVACLLGLLGRDGEARTALSRLALDGFAAVALDSRWLATMVELAELAATLDQKREAGGLYEMLLPHARLFAVEAEAADCHGSVSRSLGLLAHTLGRWDEADTHFRRAHDDNSAAGAPLLVAHTGRQWSALLRARDVGRDWERGLELLTEAEAVYRRLGVDRLADDARQVLARSHEPPARERQGSGNTFHPEGREWVLSYGGVEVRLADRLGLHDLAALLANPARSFHVTDLAAGIFVGGVGQAGQAAPATAAGGGNGVGVELEARARDECRARLAELDHELAEGGHDRDPLQVSLAWAERDSLAAELAALGGTRAADDDPVERARRTVSMRIGLALDRIDAAHFTLGRHLRHSVRTGMFCPSEPEMPTT